MLELETAEILILFWTFGERKEDGGFSFREANKPVRFELILFLSLT